MNKNKEFLQKLHQFLEDEEEIFGSLVFPAETQPQNIRPQSGIPVDTLSPNLQPENTRSPDLKHTDNLSAEPDDSRSEDLKPEGKSSPKPLNSHSPEPLNTHSLERFTTLEELKNYCASLPDLKTDLPDTNLVFGVGNPDADLMIVGEAPGEQEDKQGEPFVGSAGQLLDKILAAIGFRREDVYIANILKHRPPGNRTPTPAEMQKSLPVLLRQIDLVKPKIILCVGKSSGNTLLGKESALSQMRGRFYPFGDAQLTVTYHPAALLRNPQWKRPVWEDVKKVRQKYDESGGKP